MSSSTPGDFVLAIASAEKKVTQISILKQVPFCSLMLLFRPLTTVLEQVKGDVPKLLEDKIAGLTRERKIRDPLARKCAEPSLGGYAESI